MIKVVENQSHMELDAFHDGFEVFVEFVGGEAFDVFGANIEVARIWARMGII